METSTAAEPSPPFFHYRVQCPLSASGETPSLGPWQSEFSDIIIVLSGYLMKFNIAMENHQFE